MCATRTDLEEGTLPDPKGPRGPKGEATRARLLTAAEDVFGEVGFDQASVSEITRRAGVSNGTFYLYFPTKQTIFSELVRQISRNIRHAIQEGIGDAASRADLERRGYRAFFRYVREHPRIYRIVRQAEFVDREAFRYYYMRFAEGYITGLRRFAEDGEVRDLDLETVAWCLMGIGDLVGVRWVLLGEDGEVPDRVIDTIVDLIFHGIGPNNEGR